MRFRISHVLALMAVVALWAPLSKWLLALEAKDHPAIPQRPVDVIAFYVGTAAMLGAAMILPWMVTRERKRRVAQALAAPMRGVQDGDA